MSKRNVASYDREKRLSKADSIGMYVMDRLEMGDEKLSENEIWGEMI
jgi:hypothetical protein